MKMDEIDATLRGKNKEQQIEILRQVIQECKELLEKETEQGDVRQELKECLQKTERSCWTVKGWRWSESERDLLAMKVCTDKEFSLAGRCIQ